MNKLTIAALALCMSALAACTSQPATGTADSAASEPTPSPAPAPAETQACKAEAAGGAIGKVATADVVEQARRDAGAAVARTLAPGQVVTMEYRGDRLNLDVDSGNVVTAVRCG
jgi:hypothetical protein